MQIVELLSPEVHLLERLVALAAAICFKVFLDLFEADQGGITPQWQHSQQSYWVNTVSGFDHCAYSFLKSQIASLMTNLLLPVQTQVHWDLRCCTCLMTVSTSSEQL